jgi:hypothetical protein
MNNILIPLGDCDCPHCKAQELVDMCQKIQLWLVPQEKVKRDGSFRERDADLIGVLVMN